MPLHEFLVVSQRRMGKRAARRGHNGSGGGVGRLGCRSSGRGGSRVSAPEDAGIAWARASAVSSKERKRGEGIGTAVHNGI
jgi:hypothetical protein